MRGQRIFNELIKENGPENNSRKGRSNALLHQRNECLMARYMYYGYIRNKCYEDILRLLVDEFFLSPVTISVLIQDHTDQLQLLKQKAHSLYYFQNRWPHMKW